MNVRMFAMLTLLFLGIAGLSACGGGGEPSATREGPLHQVRVAVVEMRPEPARMEVSGEVVAQNRMEIASKVAGRVVSLPVKEGARVERGQLLLGLDAPELRSAAIQARAAEDAAKLSWEAAKRQAERYRRLAKGEVITPRDLELELVAEAVAKADYDRARAMTAMSEQNLAYAVLRAPHPGRVVKRLVREGDLATPGRTLLVLEDDQNPEVRVTLPVGTGWELIAEGEAEIIVSGRAIPAVIDRVTPTADFHTREAFLRAEDLDTPGGSYVQAALLGAPIPAIRVPDDALVHRGSLTGVFALRDERAALRWLRMTPDGRVTTGLDAGDTIILAPPASLKNGELVEVLR